MDPVFLVQLIVANLINDQKPDARIAFEQLKAIDPKNANIPMFQNAQN